MTEDMQLNWTAVAEDLQGRLAYYRGPTFRKAYLANLMASGSRLMAANDTRSGAYCFDKVREALKGISVEEAKVEQSLEVAVSPGSIELARSKLSSLEKIRHQWRTDRLLDAEVVLRRQGKRLSALENKIYREKIDKLREAGEKAVTSFQSNKVDAALLTLRSQLYRRVLKSQKVSLRPTQASAAEALKSSLFLPDTKPKAEASGIKTAPVLDTIIGPYNDRYNLGDFLTLVAQADAAWVEEFLDLYRDLRDLKGLVSTDRA